MLYGDRLTHLISADVSFSRGMIDSGSFTLYSFACLPSLQYCRQRGDLIHLHQILRGNYDTDNHLFTPSTSTTRGHTKKLFKHHKHKFIHEIKFYHYPNLLLILPLLMILKHFCTEILMIIYLILYGN